MTAGILVGHVSKIRTMAAQEVLPLLPREMQTHSQAHAVGHIERIDLLYQFLSLS